MQHPWHLCSTGFEDGLHARVGIPEKIRRSVPPGGGISAITATFVPQPHARAGVWLYRHPDSAWVRARGAVHAQFDPVARSSDAPTLRVLRTENATHPLT